MKKNKFYIKMLSFSILMFALASFTRDRIPTAYTATSTTEFITLWQVEASETVTIPLSIGEVYNFNYEWIDVISGLVVASGVHTNSNGAFETTFAVTSDYELRINGSFPRMEGYQKDMLLDVYQWGTNEWKSMKSMFRDWPGTSFSAIDAPNLSQVEDMSNMFRGASLFAWDLADWDVSNVTDMSQLFRGATTFNGDITTWDVSNVINFGGTFWDATSFNQDISQWSTGSASNMGRMFENCQSFEGDLSTWDVSNVTNMVAMFAGADLFNSDISDWNVSKVISMRAMFSRADAFNQNIGSWDVAAVTNMEVMFELADNFNQPIGEWDVSNVTNMRLMLRNATSFNQSLGNWKFNPAVNINLALTGANSMDCASWSSSIIGWAINNPDLMDFAIGGPSNTTPYDNTAAIFRDELLAQGWTIIGAFSADDCISEKYWLGTVDTEWENDSNWGPEGVPEAGDSVQIPHRANQPKLSTNSPFLRSLIIHQNALLSILSSGELNFE